MSDLYGDDLDDGLVYDVDDNVISDTEDYGDIEAPPTPKKEEPTQEKKQQQPKKRKAEEDKEASSNKKKKFSEKVCFKTFLEIYIYLIQSRVLAWCVAATDY